MLHTPGGSVAAAESIVDYLKRMFGNDVRTIVPQIAMSAGTMVACACKTIVMGSHSNMGPIDPQLRGFPAQEVLAEIERAYHELTADRSLDPFATRTFSTHPCAICTINRSF